MLSLKIDNQFIALPDSTEISIEASNPIFSDAGAKTYLFEIPVESLRYIIGNADEIYGESLYDVLEGKRAEIYIDGVQFFTGVVNLEDEISIEDGKIAVSIASGNLEFAQMIEGMNCRDVEQAEEVIVGDRYTNFNIRWTLRDDVSIVNGNIKTVYNEFYDLPDEFTMMSKDDFYNVSKEYPEKKYCTIRIACTSPNGGNIVSAWKDYTSGYPFGSPFNGEVGECLNNFYVLDASRRNSGICFYVRYFLDCLEKTLGIGFLMNEFDDVSDFNRLAFVNMRCRTKLKQKSGVTKSLNEAESVSGYIGDIPGMRIFPMLFYNITGTYTHFPAIATSENFPDVEVSKVLEAIFAAFGAKIVYNGEKNEAKIVFVKNVLQSADIVDIYTEIFSHKKIHNRRKGFRIAYESDPQDTNYNMPNMKTGNPKGSYSSILKEINPFNKSLYVDTRNGDAYVIKVDEEADSSGDEKNLNPSLFEAGAFSGVEYGICEVEDLIEEIKIPFSPIINFDINGAANKERAATSTDDANLENKYALLLDVNIEPTQKQYYRRTGDSSKIEFNGKSSLTISPQIGLSYYDFLGSQSDVSSNVNWDPLDQETTVNSYDPGFMLGIMRGPGSDAEPETFAQDFDGEGNYRVAFTAANYAFTSDSIDNCNRDFDYNGTAEGVGPDELKGRFSLKLRAGKYDKDGNPIKDADGNPIVIQDKERAERGLYDKFWKEYAYFTVNKKIIHLTCGMEIADIVNLDWTKRYKIGEWTGFIANYSFNVNKDGMSEVELDMYYL